MLLWAGNNPLNDRASFFAGESVGGDFRFLWSRHFTSLNPSFLNFWFDIIHADIYIYILFFYLYFIHFAPAMFIFLSWNYFLMKISYEEISSNITSKTTAPSTLKLYCRSIDSDTTTQLQEWRLYNLTKLIRKKKNTHHYLRNKLMVADMRSQGKIQRKYTTA